MSSVAEALRGHPRHLLAGALVAGLGIGWRSPLALAAVLLATAGLAVATRFGAPLLLALVAAVVLGALFADARLSTLDRTQLTGLIGHAVRGEVVFTQAPRAGSFGWSALGRLRGEPVLVRGNDRPPQLAAGEIATVFGSLRPLGEGDGWLAAQHVRAILKPNSLQISARQRGGLAGFVDRVRWRATGALSAQLPPAQAGLLRGMTLGDDSAMPTELRNAMRRSGLGHLVAASGANVALLILLVFALGAALAAPRSARLVFALFAIALYVPLAGSGASIQRAGVMGAAVLVAAIASRPSSRWYALLLAAIVTLALDPLAAEQPGWQLSFAAVAAIGALAGPLRERLDARRVPALISEPVALTAAATLGSAPVAAAAFGTLSLVSLPANLAAALIVAPVTWLGMVAALVGQLSAPLAAPLTWLAYWPLSAIIAIARFSASLPAAQVNAGGPIVAAGCTCLALMVRARSGHRYAATAGVLCAALAAIGLFVSRERAVLAPPAAGTTRLSFLDVGQGDATLVQSGGHAVLVDSGPPGGGVVERLREEGIEELDLLVATHAQADHLGAADEILEEIPVAAVLDGRDGVVEPEGSAMAESAARKGVPLVAPSAGDAINLGSLKLEIVSPDGNARSAREADPNQRAIVILASVAGLRLLLTADAESDVLAPLQLPMIDVLKVSHHGSSDDGLPRLLERLRPQVAVIEVGARNSYGHPTAETISALREAGVRTWRTDKDGTVRIEVDSGGLHVQRPT
ncbi:MAG: DNA internalization-related competence protein ComEC/Rec2 [Solirubrobacteraceae bacterium]|nr:DNA internalization-related competence protein ComEC/Rec2 [Solirubrobacteraceae bacterium]MDP4920611.1 DNA internalization-related competence protein ComEC/Rec2 [Solirubrobacteraceae bacterium]